MTNQEYRDAVSSHFLAAQGQFKLTLRTPEASSLEDIAAIVKRDLIRPLRGVFRGQFHVRGVLALNKRNGERCRHAHLTLKVASHHRAARTAEQLIAELLRRSRKSSMVCKTNGLHLEQIEKPEDWASYQADHLKPKDDSSEIWQYGHRQPDVRPAWLVPRNI